MTKIVLIGAGSAVFGLGTVSDIFQSETLQGSTITLHDINSNNLQKTKSIAEKNKQSLRNWNWDRIPNSNNFSFMSKNLYN